MLDIGENSFLSIAVTRETVKIKMQLPSKLFCDLFALGNNEYKTHYIYFIF